MEEMVLLIPFITKSCFYTIPNAFDNWFYCIQDVWNGFDLPSHLLTLEISFMTFEMMVLTASHAVLITFLIEFNTVEMTLLIEFQIVETTFLMASITVLMCWWLSTPVQSWFFSCTNPGTLPILAMRLNQFLRVQKIQYSFTKLNKNAFYCFPKCRNDLRKSAASATISPNTSFNQHRKIVQQCICYCKNDCRQTVNDRLNDLRKHSQQSIINHTDKSINQLW